MGTNTLSARSTGETITSAFFNDFNSALNEDLVGRNSSGAATTSQNLGTASIPWGTLYSNNIILDGNALDVSQLTSPSNRLVSGLTRTGSGQPNFLLANGSATSLIIDGTPTNLIFDVNGSAVTCNTDITISSLTVAPSSNNTCLVNDSDAADQESTRYWGEPLNDYLPWVGWDIADTATNDMVHKEVITVDNMGSEITGLVGKLAAFKINDGTNDEYFIAYVKSATELTQCFRGCFLDSTSLPVNRVKFANNDTITLMKLSWVFLTNDATTADVSYTNPIWSFDEPSGPSTGDYWYDLGNSLWKRYSGSAFVSIERALLGVSIQDATNCVATRSLDFYYDRKDIDNLITERKDATTVRGGNLNANVYVYSKLHNFNLSIIDWNITTDLASTATKDAYLGETASTIYYLYIKDTGDVIMSDIGPSQRSDLLGPYHPSNPWRCVGFTFNDSSSDLINTTAPIKNEKLSRLNSAYQASLTPAGNPTSTILPLAVVAVPSGYLYCDGCAVSRTTYATLYASIGVAYGYGDNATTFNVPDFRGYFLRGQDDGSGHDTDDTGRTALNTGGNTGDNIGSFQDDGTAVNNLSTSVTDPGHAHNIGAFSGYPGSSAYISAAATSGVVSGAALSNTTGISVSLSSSDNETRPKNVYVRYYIKY